MMFKRAILAPVFKYIFVLVAGSIILLFFVKFAFDMTTTQEKLSTAELGFVIDDSLTALSVSEDQSMPIPKDPWPSTIELDFGKGLNCGKFFLGDLPYASPKFIFSPPKLKGTQIQAWTQTWSYPFKVDSFFFLANKRSKYYLVYPSSRDVADFVGSIDSTSLPTDSLEHIPNSFDVESIPLTQVIPKLSYASQNYDFVKFVFFNSPPPSGFDANYVVVNYLDCESEKDDSDCRGSLSFPNGKRSFFVGKPMLYAAILADGFDAYSCQLSRILKRLSLVIDFNLRHAELLSLKNICSYDGIKSNLYSFKASVNAANSINYDDFNAFNIHKGNILSNNEGLGDESGCTALF